MTYEHRIGAFAQKSTNDSLAAYAAVSSDHNNSNNEKNNTLYSTPTTVTYFSKYSFGQPKGGGGMNIYFSDGDRSIGLSTAKYLVVVREIEGAVAIERKTAIIPLLSSIRIPGQSNEFQWIYAKFAVKSSDVTEEKSDPKTYDRVLLCDYRRSLVSYGKFDHISSFGIVINKKKFFEPRSILTGRSISIENTSENVDF